MEYPDFFIIGAPKCGTTSLATYLSEHPGIGFSKVKEPNYYNSDLQNQFIKSKMEYLRLFPVPSKYKLKTGKASVWYLYSKVAVRKIVEDNKNAKFIVLLRNPSEMALLLHIQHILSLNENETDFERAWELQVFRATGKYIPKLCTDPKLLAYGSVCKIGEQLLKLYQNARKENIKILFLEDLNESPVSVYKSVLNFFELEYFGRVDFKNENPTQKTQFKCIDVLMKKARFLKLKLGIPLIKNPVTEKIYTINRKKAEKQRVSEAFNNILKKYFLDDIKIVGKVTDRNLDHWKEGVPLQL